MHCYEVPRTALVPWWEEGGQQRRHERGDNQGSVLAGLGPWVAWVGTR